MAFLKNTLMCIKKKEKKVKLINHDCLPILMLLCIMLSIMLAYLMLFAALSNVVCFHNASFLPLSFANAFVFMLCLGLLTHGLFISSIILHHAQCFNLLVFPNYMLTPLSSLFY